MDYEKCAYVLLPTVIALGIYILRLFCNPDLQVTADSHIPSLDLYFPKNTLGMVAQQLACVPVGRL